jgi:hypothetical protein
MLNAWCLKFTVGKTSVVEYLLYCGVDESIHILVCIIIIIIIIIIIAVIEPVEPDRRLWFLNTAAQRMAVISLTRRALHSE